MPAIDKLCRRLDHPFANHDLLKLALRHCSAGRDNNERLEFLGDAILGFIISEELYRRFPAAREGELSRLRADLVQKGTLAGIARELELGDYLTLGSGELKSGGAKRESILADALEAVISALYLAAGMEACRTRVLAWFAGRLSSLSLDTPPKDPKTRLQEYLQSRRQALPRYEVREVSGRDHEQVFAVRCAVAVLDQAITGHGSSRREAEQQAAREALKALGQPA